MSLQEKFQTVLPVAPKDDDGNEWVRDSAARITGEAGFMHSNNASAVAECNTKLNFTPPGMELDNQKRVRINQMHLCMAGCTDISKDANPEAFEKGFTQRAMRGTDDLYTAEHVVLFYGEVHGDDGDGKVYEGFVERNNYLDRS